MILGKCVKTGDKRWFFLEIMKLKTNRLMGDKIEKCNPTSAVFEPKKGVYKTKK